MNSSDLHQLRRRLDGCELATFVDLTAGTTLLSSSAVDIGQEHLDALCDTAAELLGRVEGETTLCCIVAEPEAVRVFLQDASGGLEALCLVFAPTAVLHGVEETARRLLRNNSRTGADV